MADHTGPFNIEALPQLTKLLLHLILCSLEDVQDVDLWCDPWLRLDLQVDLYHALPLHTLVNQALVTVQLGVKAQG